MEWRAAIRLVRVIRGLAQKEVAYGAGIHFSYYSLMEAGHRPVPSPEIQQRILAALQVSMADIMLLREAPTRQPDVALGILFRRLLPKEES